MRQYPFINFSSYSTLELCEFIKNRISADIQILFAILHEGIIEKNIAVFDDEKEGLLRIQFLQLEDECKQLLRMETLVLFPFIEKQLQETGKIHVNANTLILLNNAQQKVLSLMNKIKLNLNHYISSDQFSNDQQLIINDLFKLENLLHDWIYLVHNQLLNSQLKSENYGCCSNCQKGCTKKV